MLNFMPTRPGRSSVCKGKVHILNYVSVYTLEPYLTICDHSLLRLQLAINKFEFKSVTCAGTP